MTESTAPEAAEAAATYATGYGSRWSWPDF
jgi:hypothetical protein